MVNKIKTKKLSSKAPQDNKNTIFVWLSVVAFIFVLLVGLISFYVPSFMDRSWITSNSPILRAFPIIVYGLTSIACLWLFCTLIYTFIIVSKPDTRNKKTSISAGLFFIAMSLIFISFSVVSGYGAIANAQDLIGGTQTYTGACTYQTGEVASPWFKWAPTTSVRNAHRIGYINIPGNKWQFQVSNDVYAKLAGAPVALNQMNVPLDCIQSMNIKYTVRTHKIISISYPELH